MRDDGNIARFLKRRRILRYTAFTLIALVIISVVLDHTGAFGRDTRRFDHRSVVVTRAIDGDTIAVRLPDDSRETTVHLLGVDAPSENAAKYTSARTIGRTVTLRLDP